MTSVALESSTVTTEYNGWTNRETWLTNLWLNNDMGSYEQLQEICRKDYLRRREHGEMDLR